jgi:predicted ATPase/DNA-binding winged helix-turn-helix (wHTH) protein/tetratricopeptide (TPR) repeat protein
MSEQFVFGPFRLDVGAFRVWRDELPVQVQPKVVELLILLLRRKGELISREEALATLWPGVHVSENSLPQVLHKLRELLGPQASYVETVPRKGVRFTGPASSPSPGPDDEESRWPAERDPFVGRREELAALQQLTESGARLVTVTGPGGVGKTRLLLHRHAERPTPGWYCDTREVRTVDGLLDAVAGAMGVKPGEQGLEGLGRLLARAGPRELVLDDFDLLVPHAEETLGRWLDQAPELRVVVSSRQVLGLRGEVVLPVGPLPLPDAVALFTERARARSPQVELGGTELLERLVAQLDGLPLAIELAASRCHTLSVPQLLSRLDDRFRLLSAQHTSLRATVDWSWELLEDHERQALAALTVFEGGFSASAAEALLGEERALDTLGSLVDRSWLVRGRDRFSFLSTLHEYAWTKLRAPGAFEGSGPTAALEMERRHGQWAASLDAAELSPGVDPPNAEILRQERANLAVACRRALDRGDGPVAVAAARAAARVPQRHEPVAALLEQVLAMPLPAELYVQAAEMAGVVASRRGLLGPVREHLLRALRLADSPLLEGRLQYLLAVGEVNEGRDAVARPLAEAALARAQALSDTWIELATREMLGYLDRADSSLAARQRLEEGVALARAHRQGSWEQNLLAKLGRWYVARGELAAALPCYARALEVPGAPKDGQACVRYAQLKTMLGQFEPEDYLVALRTADPDAEPTWKALAHGYFAQALLDHGDPERALRHVHEALELLDPEDQLNVGWARLVRAQVLLALGQTEAAWTDWHAARQRKIVVESLLHVVASELHAASGAHAEALAAAERAQQASIRAATPMVTARALCLQAEALRAQGQPEQAAPLLQEAGQIVDLAGLGPQSWLSRKLQALAS